MPIGSINDLIAKLNETKEPKEKDETATWRTVPNRAARRHDGRPLPRTGQAARYRRVVAARPRHQASVSAALRATRKVEARKAVAADRRLVTAVADAARAMAWAELFVLNAEQRA